MSSIIPRQLLRARHPLYDWFLGIVLGLLPNLRSAVNIISGPGAAPLNIPPLLKAGYMPVQFPGSGMNYCGPGNNGAAEGTNGLDDCCQAHDNCYGSGLSWLDALPFSTVGPTGKACNQALCNCIKGLPPTSDTNELLWRRDVARYFGCF